MEIKQGKDTEEDKFRLAVLYPKSSMAGLEIHESTFKECDGIPYTIPSVYMYDHNPHLLCSNVSMFPLFYSQTTLAYLDPLAKELKKDMSVIPAILPWNCPQASLMYSSSSIKIEWRVWRKSRRRKTRRKQRKRRRRRRRRKRQMRRRRRKSRQGKRQGRQRGEEIKRTGGGRQKMPRRTITPFGTRKNYVPGRCCH
jgi:hypothetical protein